MPVGTTHGDGGHLDRTETHMSTCTFRDGPHAEQGEAGKEERVLLQLHANSRQTQKQTARGTMRT